MSCNQILVTWQAVPYKITRVALLPTSVVFVKVPRVFQFMHIIGIVLVQNSDNMLAMLSSSLTLLLCHSIITSAIPTRFTRLDSRQISNLPDAYPKIPSDDDDSPSSVKQNDEFRGWIPEIRIDRICTWKWDLPTCNTHCHEICHTQQHCDFGMCYPWHCCDDSVLMFPAWDPHY